MTWWGKRVGQMIDIGKVEVKKDIGHMSGNEAGLKSAGSQCSPAVSKRRTLLQGILSY